MMRPIGRPQVLNDFKKRQICAAVRAGASLATAAKFVGCSAATARNAAKRDEAYAAQLAAALASSEAKRVGSIVRESKRSSRSTAWIMERRSRDSSVQCVTHEQFVIIVQLARNVVTDVMTEPQPRRAALSRLDQLIKAWRTGLLALPRTYYPPAEPSRGQSASQSDGVTASQSEGATASQSEGVTAPGHAFFGADNAWRLGAPADAVISLQFDPAFQLEVGPAGEGI